MPTVGWIQETSWDRFYERGASSHSEKTMEYPCRMCGAVFLSLSERDQHEVGHPVLNPCIFIGGKEIVSERITISRVLKDGSVYPRNVEYINVNGNSCSPNDLQVLINSEKNAFINVVYGNNNIEKQLKIDICIADKDEILAVEIAFNECFGIFGLTEKAIVAFSDKVRGMNTVKNYGDGVVRYLQGVMAKDNRSSSFGFDEFYERFNQATQSLKEYDTALSGAIRAVVNFNRNDFSAIQRSGIPALDSVISFFKGGDLMDSSHSKEVSQLPVDHATDKILQLLLGSYKTSMLENLEADIKDISPHFLSLQDRVKFDYIFWRKSREEGNTSAEKNYYKRLKNDDAFTEILEQVK